MLPPRLVYWEITKRCNLRCSHCRAVPQSCQSSDELSLAEGFRLIDAIAEVGQPILVLTGGEPLLRSDLFDLATYGVWRGLPMALATNGTLVTREVAKRVVNAGFKRVSISLDGPDAETHDNFRRVPGAFDDAVDGFIHLKELGMSMQVNTTVTVHNRERLEETYELVRKLGADAWHLFLLVPVGCGLEIARSAQLTPRDYEEVLFWIDDLAQSEAQSGGMEIRATCAPHAQRIRLQREALAEREASSVMREASESGGRGTLHEGRSVKPQTRRGCLAGTGICFISHRGKVFPCGYLPIQAGDTRQQPFARIWETAPLFADLRDPGRLMGKCGVCEYRVVCGGCRARAFGQTGHYLNEEPFCNYLPSPIANSK
ncbi:MAG: radical SAM protein [Nitrospirae bacterium]|nr:radical SAM protein [Nitrospirota bacterium]